MIMITILLLLLILTIIIINIIITINTNNNNTKDIIIVIIIIIIIIVMLLTRPYAFRWAACGSTPVGIHYFTDALYMIGEGGSAPKGGRHSTIYFDSR